MKKLFTLVAILVTTLSFNEVFAQCPLDLSNATFGFTPTSSSVAQNATETQNIKVYIPGMVSTYTIDSVVVTGITGFPTGVTYTLNPANGHIVTSSAGGNGEGTICLSGSTSAAAGSYPLTFAGTITLAGLGTQNISLVQTVDPTFGDTVVVTAGAVLPSCDTIFNDNLATDTPSLFGWNPGVGIISGNGGFTYQGTTYPTTSVAEKFTAGVGDSVTAGFVAFGFVTVNSGDSAQLVKFYLFDNSGTANGVSTGGPGLALDSATLSLGAIALDVTGRKLTVVNFTHDVLLTTAGFYISVKLPTTTGDTLGVLTNSGNTFQGQGYFDVPTAGGWFPYTGIVGGIDSLGNFIGASVCGTAFPPLAAFTASATTGCSPLAVTFTDASTGGTGYSWNFGDGSAASTAQNPSHTYTAGGNYTVTETVTNTTGSATFSTSITINAAPATTVYVTNASSGSASNGAAGVVVTGGTGTNTYLWSNTSTTDSVTGLAPATYYVTVTNSNTCRTVDTVVIAVTGINTLSDDVTVKIYPNPANDVLNFQWSLNTEADVVLYDVTGNLVKSFVINGTTVNSFDIHDLSAGTYVIRVTDRQNNEQRSSLFSKF